MSAHIIIRNFGPISECDMTLDNFTVLTGAQASGKSTIAKCIYFCRTIKDDILDEIIKYQTVYGSKISRSSIFKTLRNKFLQIFGTSKAMRHDMYLSYKYSENTFVNIFLKIEENTEFFNPNYLFIDFSDDINDFINSNITFTDREELQKILNTVFHDNYKSIYIPAGRSLITLLSSQLNYFFATMDDDQKRSIDFCTQRYIEYILRIRPLFSDGVDGLIEQKFEKSKRKQILLLQELVSKVIKGRYVFVNNEERLYLSDNRDQSDRFVKINYTSSGQQEAVWIFNMLFYLLVNDQEAFIILEEPEAHLYPDAQKHMAEVLALFSNLSCQMFITTHSPYILGTINNLIYANYLSQSVSSADRLNEVIDPLCRIKNHNAFFVEGGVINQCVEDSSEKLIKNEVIDGASDEINNDYDQLFEMAMEAK